MRVLWTLIYKDFLLLARDKVGLAVLFLMPVFFVFTITLLQAGHGAQSSKVPVLLISYGHGNIINQLKKSFSKQKHFLVKEVSPAQRQEAKQLVASGKYKLLVVIPKNTSKVLTLNTQQGMVKSAKSRVKPVDIDLIFDPAINPVVRNDIVSHVKSFLRISQMQAMANVVSEVLGTAITKVTKQPLPVKISYAGQRAKAVSPNAVQQNIPAWALFGMFFIAIPLASVIVKERNQGVLQRYYVAPIQKSLLLIAHVIAFMCVNLLQLWLMLLVGVVVMPWLGLPALDLSGHVLLVMIIGLCSAFAATSFGLFVGSCSRTIEQATAAAPILIVIAAAIGGIMIPIYLMPASMQVFAAFSPLHWGHEAFLDVLVRHARLQQILWPLAKLSLFSVILCLYSSRFKK